MSDQDVINEAKAIVDDLINPDTLSILDYIENVGTVLPAKTVTFYLDLATGVELQETIEARDAEEVRIARERAGFAFQAANEARSIGDEDEPEADTSRLVELNAKIDALRAKATKSGLEFHLRGVSPKSQQDIQEGVLRSSIPEDEQDRALTFQIAAKNFVKVVVQANGQTITEFNAAVAERLIKSLPLPDQIRFMEVIKVLNTAAVLGDPAVDAGFPGELARAASEQGASDGLVGGTGVGD